MGAIYRREMGAFFTSGVAYVFLTVFTLLSGIFFFFGVIASGTTETSPMFSSMFIVVLFLIPILTMKLLSEEKKNRTDQGLLTAPIGLWSIVLGKYFAALTLFRGTYSFRHRRERHLHLFTDTRISRRRRMAVAARQLLRDAVPRSRIHRSGTLYLLPYGEPDGSSRSEYARTLCALPL